MAIMAILTLLLGTGLRQGSTGHIYSRSDHFCRFLHFLPIPHFRDSVTSPDSLSNPRGLHIGFHMGLGRSLSGRQESSLSRLCPESHFRHLLDFRGFDQNRESGLFLAGIAFPRVV